MTSHPCQVDCSTVRVPGRSQKLLAGQVGSGFMKADGYEESESPQEQSSQCG